jgi:hypothetical protein
MLTIVTAGTEIGFGSVGYDLHTLSRVSRLLPKHCTSGVILSIGARVTPIRTIGSHIRGSTTRDVGIYEQCYP